MGSDWENILAAHITSPCFAYNGCKCIFFNGNMLILMKMWLKFVPKDQLIISQHWFRSWLGAKKVIVLKNVHCCQTDGFKYHQWPQSSQYDYFLYQYLTTKKQHQICILWWTKNMHIIVNIFNPLDAVRCIFFTQSWQTISRNSANKKSSMFLQNFLHKVPSIEKTI